MTYYHDPISARIYDADAMEALLDGDTTSGEDLHSYPMAVAYSEAEYSGCEFNRNAADFGYDTPAEVYDDIEEEATYALVASPFFVGKVAIKWRSECDGEPQAELHHLELIPYARTLAGSPAAYIEEIQDMRG